MGKIQGKWSGKARYSNTVPRLPSLYTTNLLYSKRIKGKTLAQRAHTHTQGVNNQHITINSK